MVLKRLAPLSLLVFCVIAAPQTRQTQKNVKEEELSICSTDPMTGWFRDGRCNTAAHDHGTHVVCAQMTEEFLTFTKARGNDLSSPSPGNRFPGLVAGDRWCLCALRWREAEEAGKAPDVVLDATHQKALQYIDMEILEEHEA